MTRDEILNLAAECHLTDSDLGPGMTDYGNSTGAILEFAARVAAKEREECAKAANEWLTNGRNPLGRKVSEVILARGKE